MNTRDPGLGCDSGSVPFFAGLVQSRNLGQVYLLRVSMVPRVWMWGRKESDTPERLSLLLVAQRQ